MAIFYFKRKESNVNKLSKYIEMVESADMMKITKEGHKWLEVGEIPQSATPPLRAGKLR